MPAGHGLGACPKSAWTAGRRTFEMRPTNLLRLFSNSARSILINPLFRKIKKFFSHAKVENLIKALCADFYRTPSILVKVKAIYQTEQMQKHQSTQFLSYDSIEQKT